MNGGQGVWLLLFDHVSAHQLHCEWLLRNLHKPSQPGCSAWFGDKRVTIMFKFINMKAFLLFLSSVLFKVCVYSLVTSCTNTMYLDDLQSLILLPSPPRTLCTPSAQLWCPPLPLSTSLFSSFPSSIFLHLHLLFLLIPHFLQLYLTP